MPPSSSTSRNLPPGYELKPSGREIIAQYLGPKALRGGGAIPVPGYVVEGVDVFSASPDALPFQPSHRRRDGEVWGCFLAVQPAGGDMRPGPGGRWLRYGAEKWYYEHGDGGEAVAFRHRFAFHVARPSGDGRAVWVPTQWLMKQYRLNKGAAAFRRTQPDPKADMDCVVRKVFTKPVISPPPPSSSSEEDTGHSSDEDQARKRVGCSIGSRARKRARSS